jgi:O-antigen/teichoic acid export membrane protein
MEKRFSDMIEETARGGLVLILGQVSATLISALGVIIVARIIGSTSYGLLSIAVIPVQIFLMLIKNGVANAVTNFIAEDRHLAEGKNTARAPTTSPNNSVVCATWTLVLREFRIQGHAYINPSSF